ncbi:hypothetical protein BLL52_4123 [Rhodoferax antarcticus ANT.BR]|uniref:Uncharacterized protein n=2 Tax=Rhodoferax antarcticus TaxID=81479 RepID=A0A1Q8Y8Z3_9BURK|nr:hypothetical protein BLL52_4123 [Rhodoferax antarcticus ANT.BR]
MNEDSSAFASGLADLWFKADLDNRRRIESAFPAMIDAFKPDVLPFKFGA